VTSIVCNLLVGRPQQVCNFLFWPQLVNGKHRWKLFCLYYNNIKINLLLITYFISIIIKLQIFIIIIKTVCWIFKVVKNASLNCLKNSGVFICRHVPTAAYFSRDFFFDIDGIAYCKLGETYYIVFCYCKKH